VTKRSDSMVRQNGPRFGIDLWIFPVPILAPTRGPFGQVSPSRRRAPRWSRARGRSSIDLLMRSPASWKQVRPSKAVPACRRLDRAQRLPARGIEPISLSPAANQTFRPSYVTHARCRPPKRVHTHATISAVDSPHAFQHEPAATEPTALVLRRKRVDAPAARARLLRAQSQGRARPRISPSARKASSAACSSSTGRASTTTWRAAARRQRNLASSRSPRQRPKHARSRPIRLASAHDAIHRRVSIRRRRDQRVPRVRPRHASPSARARENDTDAWRGDPLLASRTTRRRASTTNAFDSSNASTSSSRRSAPRHWSAGRGGRVQDEECACDLRSQGRIRAGARMFGSSERGARRSSSGDAASRSPRLPTRGRSSMRREGAGGSWRAYARPRRCADQEEAPDLEIPRMRGVTGAVLFERRARRLERLGRPAQSRETSAISASRRRT